MRHIMLPPSGPNRRLRSEQDREALQARWWTMVSKLLKITQGPFSIKMAHASAIGQSDTPCPHPKECIARGANQYGSWTRCLRCKTKLEFVPFSATNPKTQTKKSSRMTTSQDPQQVAEMKELATYVKQSIKGTKNSELVTKKEMQAMMSEQAQTISAGLMQALGPIVQNQQMMQHQMAQMATSSSAYPSQMPVAPQQFDLTGQDPVDEAMENPNDWEALCPR